MTLTEIANRLGCDKGTEAHEAHGYTEIYEFAIRKQCRMLEIGIDKGLSVKMWSEWSDDIDLIAIDNRQEVFTPEVRGLCDARVCDQSKADDLEFLAESLGNESLDYIIDDGSHRPDDQMLSLVTLWRCLNPGGTYFVEDCHASALFPEQRPIMPRLESFAAQMETDVFVTYGGKLALISKAEA